MVNNLNDNLNYDKKTKDVLIKDTNLSYLERNQELEKHIISNIVNFDKLNLEYNDSREIIYSDCFSTMNGVVIGTLNSHEPTVRDIITELNENGNPDIKSLHLVTISKLQLCKQINVDDNIKLNFN